MIRYLRTAAPEIHHSLHAQPVAVSVVTRAEILHGAKNDLDFDRLTNILDAFVQIGVDSGAWVDVARHLYQLRRRGILVPFQDVLIATLAIRQDIEVWTYDTHFQLMQSVLPSRVKREMTDPPSHAGSRNIPPCLPKPGFSFT